MLRKTLLINLLILSFQVFGQTSGVRGTVLDQQSRHPIAYANISILANDTLVSGGITNDKGMFHISKIKPGKYYITISFMGYETVNYDHIILSNGIRNMGEILLKPDSRNLKEVVVHAGKPAITYKVDRQVINASSFPEADVAMDLLENIPELKVDVSGKLVYRDHMSLSVYINGKPVANGQERLRQLNAKQIDKIELITNPSAKYSSEGTGGIINVILKKNRLKGYAISSSLSYNTKGGYGWLFNIGKNTKRSEWHLDMAYQQYAFLENSHVTLEINNLIPKKTIIQAQQNTTRHINNYLDFGYNYDLTEKDEIDISFNINPFSRIEDHRYQNKYTEIISGSSPVTFNSSTHDKMTYQYYGPEFSYTHKFNKEDDKKISFDASYSAYLKNYDETYMDVLNYDTGTIKQGYVYDEQDEKILDISLDFEYPLKKWTIETGTSITTDFIPKTTTKNGYFDANNHINNFPGDYHYQTVTFKRNIYAGYLSLSTIWHKWAVKTGLRMEYTDRQADFTYNYTDDPQQAVVQPYQKHFINFFPNMHLQYNLKEFRNLSFSYSKRISRPNYFRLMPVKQYESPYAYYLGNAGIKPELVNHWEMKFYNAWDKDYIATSVFLIHKADLQTQYMRVDNDGKIYYQGINAGNSDYIGADLTVNYHLYSWWNINLSGSLYHLSLYTNVDNDKRHQESISGYITLNQTFNLPYQMKLKLNTYYATPWIGIQANGNSDIRTQFSIQKRFGKHWQLFLLGNNIWGDIHSENFRKGKDFKQETITTTKQYFGLKLSYNFNNRNQ